MNHTMNDGFVCLKEERDETGMLVQILFRHGNGAFGTFDGAQIMPRLSDDAGPELQQVRMNQLIDTLARLVGFRDRLQVIPDFREVPHDHTGMPMVFQARPVCDACGHEWHLEGSMIGPMQACPRCKSHVDVDLSRLLWVGPPSPILQALWGRLQFPERMNFMLKDGLELTSSGKKVRLQDAQGHGFAYEAREDGIHLEILRDGSRQPVLVHVNERQTTISVTEIDGSAVR